MIQDLAFLIRKYLFQRESLQIGETFRVYFSHLVHSNPFLTLFDGVLIQGVERTAIFTQGEVIMVIVGDGDSHHSKTIVGPHELQRCFFSALRAGDPATGSVFLKRVVRNFHGALLRMKY